MTCERWSDVAHFNIQDKIYQHITELYVRQKHSMSEIDKKIQISVIDLKEEGCCLIFGWITGCIMGTLPGNTSGDRWYIAFLLLSEELNDNKTEAARYHNANTANIWYLTDHMQNDSTWFCT